MWATDAWLVCQFQPIQTEKDKQRGPLNKMGIKFKGKW